MPFTPFHMGPGLLIKAVAGDRFSVTVFGVAQVAMDLEPLGRIYAGSADLHGVSHTWVASTAIGLVVAPSARPVCEALVRWWNRELARRGAGAWTSPTGIGLAVAFVSALAGTWSHILLDSTLYAAMRPWWPFSEGNGLLDAVSAMELHGACVAAGLAGVGVWVLRGGLRGRAGGQ